jgi:hypothetical protein
VFSSMLHVGSAVTAILLSLLQAPRPQQQSNVPVADAG